MTWTGPKQLKAQLARLWERGELLRDAVTGNTLFPLRLTLKSPVQRDITDRFDARSRMGAELDATNPVRFEWRRGATSRARDTIAASERQDRYHGRRADLAGKRREWDRFSDQVSQCDNTHPALLPGWRSVR